MKFRMAPGTLVGASYILAISIFYLLIFVLFCTWQRWFKNKHLRRCLRCHCTWMAGMVCLLPSCSKQRLALGSPAGHSPHYPRFLPTFLISIPCLSSHRHLKLQALAFSLPGNLRNTPHFPTYALTQSYCSEKQCLILSLRWYDTYDSLGTKTQITHWRIWLNIYDYWISQFSIFWRWKKYLERAKMKRKKRLPHVGRISERHQNNFQASLENHLPLRFRNDLCAKKI